MKILKETESYVLVDYNTPESRWINPPTKEQKLWCIGGEFNGTRKARCQLKEDEYTQFNCSVHKRWSNSLPKAVYISKYSLPDSI